MATAAEHRAEIDRINGEVAAQAHKIAAISDVLTEKGSESSAVGDNATTPIKQNTNDLDALLAKAQALPDKVVLQEKSVTPTTSAQTVTPDSNYDGLSKVNVAKIPDTYIQPNGTKAITENGTHDVTEFASVDVNVAGSGGGGALQVATGVFTPSNVILYSAPIRVSGLGFRPKYVFARCEISVLVPYFLGIYPCNMLGAIFGGDGDVPAIAAYLNASSQAATTTRMEFSNNDVYTIAFNDDGFEIKTTVSSGKIYANGQWTYYAVG
jgi:hypothetical protein